MRLYGFEAGGDGFDTGRHAATITAGQVGVLHGTRSYLLQDEDGQTIESHSISAGLDYPGVGPEHAYLHETGRASYRPVSDARGDGRDGAAHPDRGDHPRDRERACAGRGAPGGPRARPGRDVLVVCLSGRGDKDMDTAAEWFRLLGGDRPGDLARGERRSRHDPRRRAPRVGRRWSATCQPDSRPSSQSVEVVRALVDSGVDVVEVGLPYSDPVMDGPTIQAAAEVRWRPAPAPQTSSGSWPPSPTWLRRWS